MESERNLFQVNACDVLDKLRVGEITPRDLLDMLEAQIAELDGEVNALPTRCFDPSDRLPLSLQSRLGLPTR